MFLNASSEDAGTALAVEVWSEIVHFRLSD